MKFPLGRFMYSTHRKLMCHTIFRNAICLATRQFCLCLNNCNKKCLENRITHLYSSYKLQGNSYICGTTDTEELDKKQIKIDFNTTKLSASREDDMLRNHGDLTVSIKDKSAEKDNPLEVESEKNEHQSLNKEQKPTTYSSAQFLISAGGLATILFLLLIDVDSSSSEGKVKPMKLKSWKRILDGFEDFNDWTYDWIIDNIINKIFPLSNEPLLPEFEDLGYPVNLPTLVLDLNKLICKLSHNRKNGWGIVKRPGADRLFKELMHYYEIVIWSDEIFPIPQDAVNKWNLPVIGVLDRTQCTRKRGKIIKDLSRLGRNLNRVLLIDHDSNAASMQPNNAIILSSYDGDPTDRELEYLIDFLKAAAVQPDSLQDFLNKYGGGDKNIGLRYKLEKTEIERKSQARRPLGKFFASKGINT
ncbi:NLI interacting factor-like phosphatase family protein [Cryptosporidium serpentis]